MINWLRRRLRPEPPQWLPVGSAWSGGYIDFVSPILDGTSKIRGWARANMDPARSLVVRIDGENAELLWAYEDRRADLAGVGGQGFELEYRCEPLGTVADSVHDDDQLVCARRMNAARSPRYAFLLDTSEVIRRSSIYGTGAPTKLINDDILELASTLPGPLLDFGCGSGAMVERLRNNNREALGLEIDARRIRDFFGSELPEYVQLYDGRFPLPFSDGAFRSVLAIEVLEHTESPEAIIAELARITSENLMLTVPDATGIARLGNQHVVPWHLLESTHFHFFNQRSLDRLLAPYFSQRRWFRFGRVQTNDVEWFDTLGVVARA